MSSIDTTSTNTFMLDTPVAEDIKTALPNADISSSVNAILQSTTPEDRIQELLSHLTWGIEQTSEGLIVTPSKLGDTNMIRRFLDRIFLYDSSSDSDWEYFYLADANIDALMKLLYANTWDVLPDTMKIASCIKVMPKERKSLYRKIKPFKDRSGKTMEATYFFEQVHIIEKTTSVVPGSDVPEEIEVEKVTTLQFDEFVAHLWRSGIVYGIQSDLIKNCIKDGTFWSQTVASGNLPEPGKPAIVVEEKKDMHKNRAPKEVAAGMFDFSQFSVSFPEVKLGEKILKKIPRVLWIDGRDILGNIIAWDVPKDLNIKDFSWSNTQVLEDLGIEYIVAGMEWFLSVDEKSRTVSVNSNLVQKWPIAYRTTGNLHNLVAVMEISGGIEDGRVLDGKGFTITGAVAGKLVRATEFDITINGPARNGKLEALKWNIFIQNGLVSNEAIYAPEGTVEIFGNIESWTSICAKKVIIHGSAFNSLIIADEIDMQSATSCQILGKNISIENLLVKHAVENIVFVEIPNIDAENKKTKELTENIQLVKKSIAILQEKSTLLKKQTPIPIEKIVAFLNSIAENKAKAESMSELDRKHFKAIMPYLEIVKKYIGVIKEIVQREAEIIKQEDEIRTMYEAIQEVQWEVGLIVKQVSGESRILTVKFDTSRDEVLDIPKSLGVVRTISSLNAKTGKDQLIFDGTTGMVEWKIPVVSVDSASLT